MSQEKQGIGRRERGAIWSGENGPTRTQLGYRRLLQAGTSSLVGACTLLGSAMSDVARAAELDAQVEATEPEDEDAIVVTATRRGTSEQRIPASISAVSGEEIAELGIGNYDDLLRTIPGVTSGGSSNLNNIVIRGISSSVQIASTGGQDLVTVYLDELPITSYSIVTPDIQPYDLSHVEVLRGPQGTLFGSGSMAGAIRYITNTPDASSYDASVDVEFGATSGALARERISAMVNLPLVEDELALRIVGYYRDQDGYIDQVSPALQDTNTLEDSGIRAALRWTPTANFSATLSAMHNTNNVGDLSLYDPDLGLHQSAAAAPFVAEAEMTSATALLEFDLGWANLVSATTYAHAPASYHLQADAIAPWIYYFERNVIDSLAQEVRLVSAGDGPFQWVTGVYYLQQNSPFVGALYASTEFVQSNNITGLPSNYTDGAEIYNYIEDRDLTELAVFGEFSYQLTDSVTLTAGGRYAETEFTISRNAGGFDSVGFFDAAFGGGNANLALQPVAVYSYGTGPETRFSPKFSVQWDFAEDQMLYALVSQGFRRAEANDNAGASIVDPLDPLIIPEVTQGDGLWNYELGAKALWFDGRLRANVALYFIDWSPMQVAVFRTSDSRPYTEVVGASESIGLEVEFAYRPNDSLELGGNMSLQDAQITELSAQEALASGAVEGAALPTPEFKIGAYIRYNWHIGNADLFVRADVQHVGSYPNIFPNTPGFAAPNPNYAIIPAYENVNLAIGYNTDSVGVVLYAENALDSDNITYIDPSAFSHNRYGTLRPRTIGVRLSYQY